MRRGMNTLALTVQQGLGRDPHAGEIFCFRGRKGDRGLRRLAITHKYLNGFADRIG